MIVGLPQGPLTSEWERRFSELTPAGVILFRRDVESPAALRSLVDRLNGLAAEHGFSPLLVAADEEGGFLSPVLGPRDPAPPAMALGSIGSESLAFETAREVGSRLRAAGLNLNFAPCVDVNDEPRNPVIGPRSFGADPDLVARLGVQTVWGLRSGGVLTTAKHFPGHGSTTEDSHKTLPSDARSLEVLRVTALVPFAAVVEAGVDLLMTAHVAYPAVTGTPGEPATFSRRAIEDLARGEVRFEGPVITDALEMAAVADRTSPEEAAARALSAGADLLLYSAGDGTPWRVREFLAGELSSGALSEERIERSLLRVQRMKAAIPDGVTGGPMPGLFDGVRRRGVTVLDDPGHLLPIRMGPGQSLGVLVPDPGLPEGSIGVGHLRAELAARHDRVTLVPASPREPAALEDLSACDVGLLFVLSRGPLDAWQAELVRRASRLPSRLVLVAALNPHALPELERPAARVASYDFSPPAISALVDRLFVGAPS